MSVELTRYFLIFTVRSRESSTDRGDGRAPADDELIVLTLVVRGLRLAQYHVLHVQPGVTTTDNSGMSHCPILYAETWLRILIFPNFPPPTVIVYIKYLI